MADWGGWLSVALKFIIIWNMQSFPSQEVMRARSPASLPLCLLLALRHCEHNVNVKGVQPAKQTVTSTISLLTLRFRAHVENNQRLKSFRSLFRSRVEVVVDVIINNWFEFGAAAFIFTILSHICRNFDVNPVQAEIQRLKGAVCQI